MFEIIETIVLGCRQLIPTVRADERGRLVKVFHQEACAAAGLPTGYAEQYHSTSQRGVLRGLHFQEPPFEHDKLLYCVCGKVCDVAVDVRVGSPSFGEHVMLELSAELANIIFIPRGLAHGFLALTEGATIINSATSVYAPQADGGIAWNSAGIEWPEATPILSERDAALPPLAAYESPFRY